MKNLFIDILCFGFYLVLMQVAEHFAETKSMVFGWGALAAFIWNFINEYKD